MSEDAVNLFPPPRTSLDDPGAHDLASESGSEDHFSDAQSGLNSPNSPIIPTTRVEKVNDESSYGEVPGTEAYNKRADDARPDEIAVISNSISPKLAASAIDRPSTPGGHPIPTTVVEKIDPEVSSHGEVPGTRAYQKHEADAVPDSIIKIGSNPGTPARSRAGSTPGDLPIPITKVERVDSNLRYGEVPGTEAFEKRKGDAEPDIVEHVEDIPGSPTSSVLRSPTVNQTQTRRKSSVVKKTEPVLEYDEEGDGDDGFGDDFDDFEEGEEADFNDFEDGFQEPETISAPPPQPFSTVVPVFPVLNFDEVDGREEVISATEPYINAIFPPDTIDTSSLPPAQQDNSIFLSQRSASLWSQLVAPPSLQPPNWIRSRIRRLFLVSLGVPVDLDEILPASKQKKLILPSIHLHANTASPRTSTDARSIIRLKGNADNASNTSLDSQNNPRPSSKRRRGPPPSPELDLVSARQLCTMTDQALIGLTNQELDAHVKKLEAMQGTANEVLEYWTKRTDEKIGDREAFEGVIENLVKHARKTRK